MHGSAELFRAGGFFSRDVRVGHVWRGEKEASNNPNNGVPQGMLLRHVRLDELEALGVGMAAYIVSYETSSREPAVTPSRLPAVAEPLFEMEMSTLLRSKAPLRDCFYGWTNQDGYS